MAYYLYDGKTTSGPFAAPELAARPDFGAETLVCPVGGDAWTPAAKFPDLAELLTPSAPPPPPPPPPPKASSGISLQLPTMEPWKNPGLAIPAAPESAVPDPAAAPGEIALRPSSPTKKLILIVDDDPDVLSFVEMCATAQGFRVVTASNGNDAARKLEARAPDLIVTDLMMPGQNGYELLRNLQAAGQAAIPVIVITGSAIDKSTITMIRQEANVVEFLNKPIGMAKLVAAMHSILGTAPGT
jgi:CheY-like chemotaxis protein